MNTAIIKEVRVWPVRETDVPEIERLTEGEVPEGMRVHQFRFGRDLAIRWWIDGADLFEGDAPHASGYFMLRTQEQRNHAVTLMHKFATAFKALDNSDIPF